jgi:hypothetical protein
VTAAGSASTLGTLTSDSIRGQQTPADQYEALARELVAATAAARELLDPDLRARLVAERERGRAERTCSSCGCDPLDCGRW